jgi:hypothetical protein
MITTQPSDDIGAFLEFMASTLLKDTEVSAITLPLYPDFPRPRLL